MAKVRGPLFSVDAVGHIGEAITVRSNHAGHHVYLRGDPGSVQRYIVPSPAQVAVREEYRFANDAWRALPPAGREVWNDLAMDSGRNVSGWNLWLAKWMKCGYMPEDGELSLERCGGILLEDLTGVLIQEEVI